MAIKLLTGNRIYPALFVIGSKSVNRNKYDQGAGMWLWPTCLDWKSKSNPAGFTCCKTYSDGSVAHGNGGVLTKARFRTGIFIGRFGTFQDTPVQKLPNPIQLIEIDQPSRNHQAAGGTVSLTKKPVA